MNYSDYLEHHGILGQKWGLRRWQNEDGSLTEEGRVHYMKKNTKWAKKNYNKIYKEVYKKSRNELEDYLENDLDKRTDIQKYNSDGKISLSYLNEFNKKMAEVMTKNAADIKVPYGDMLVKYITKRGGYGVHMIISEQQFNINTLRNGVYDSGKIAYRKQYVNRDEDNS